jgi:formate-dependent nitrite reductase membrane component NrfD
MPQHFVASPEWGWYIVAYFFLGGIAGGAYALGTLLRIFGNERDAPVARLAFLISFPALVICPILLTLDLGKPFRFWHMLIDAGTWSPVFKYWSPMSIGAWALTAFGLFSLVSFLQAYRGNQRHPLDGGLRTALNTVFMIIGSLLGLFIAGYTGVLLSVSNQPIWSDTWALGGLFLASGLSTAAATIAIAAASRRDTSATAGKLWAADRYFILLELALLAIFFVTLGPVAGMVIQSPWLVFWVIVLAGTIIPLLLHLRPGTAAMAVVAGGLVLVGSLALRIVIVYSAQV